MNPGALNKRIVLQQPGGAQGSDGERITTWTDIATVSASIRSLSSRESMQAAQRMMISTHMIEVRYSTTIASLSGAWRIKFGSRIFTIDGVQNIGERNEKFAITCTEGARTE